jgi:hypothetical protein
LESGCLMELLVRMLDSHLFQNRLGDELSRALRTDCRKQKAL